MASRLNDRQLKSLIKNENVGRHSLGNGLFFRVRSKGGASWVLRYTLHGNRREMVLGSYPYLSLADATAEAVRIRQKVRNENFDPIAEKQKVDNQQFKTIDDLAEDWLLDCEKRLKNPQIPRRVYTKDLSPSLGRIPIDQVSPLDIRAVITRIAKSNRPTIANDALMYCKQLFRHAIKLDIIVNNPAAPFSSIDAGGAEKSRTRALDLKEIEKVFDCFRKNCNQFTRENYLATALLLVLGVRKGELIAAEWKEFDLCESLWNLPEERSKTGAAITVPLPYQAVAWLEELKIRAYNSEFVFPNRRTSKRFGHISPDTLNQAVYKLHREKKFELEHFTIHDLRRSFRSLLSEKGIPGHIAERCLNHKIKGVEGIYDRYDYLKERKEALQVIADTLSPIIDK